MALKVEQRTPIPVVAPAAFALVAAAPAPLSVPWIGQEGEHLCWAACADMVLDFLGDPAPRQCDFASWLFGKPDCCANLSAPECDDYCQPADVATVFGHWAVLATFIPNSVPFSDLVNEIAGQRPVEVAYQTGGVGHVVLVVSAGSVAGQDWITVNDPKFGAVGRAYADLLTAGGTGTWFATWTGIQR